MHLIQQHTIQVHSNSLDKGKDIYAKISEVLEKELCPKLEALLDKYSEDDLLKTYDNLSIRLPKISTQNWKEQFVQKTLAEIEKQLCISTKTENKETNKPHITYSSKQDELKRILLLYLQTGLLEVNSFCITLDALWDAIVLDSPFLLSLSNILIQDSHALKRWVYNLPQKFHKKTLAVLQITSLPLASTFFSERNHLSRAKPSTLEKLIKEVNVIGLSNTDFNEILALFNWYVILYFHSKKKTKSIDVFRNSIHEILGSPTEKEVLIIFTQILEQSSNYFKTTPTKIRIKKDNVKTFDTDRKKKNSTTIYIKNAGLIILHPFLKEYFTKLNLVKNKKWVNNKAQQRAVLLLQYLINGEEKTVENELVLNKILCGFEISDYVNTNFKITEEEKLESEKLLNTIIKHWKKIKNTSVSTLRNTFLQREGKLIIQTNGDFLLTITPKGVDILLDYLPWSINEVRTPWMEGKIDSKRS